MDHSYRLLIATGVSLIILLVWQYFFPRLPVYETVNNKTGIESGHEIYSKRSSDGERNSGVAIRSSEGENGIASISNGKRDEVRFANEYIDGSINLLGAKLDELRLLKYNEELVDDKGGNSKKVVLLSSSHHRGSQDYDRSNFISLGFYNNVHYNSDSVSSVVAIKFPDHNSIWKADKKILSAGESVHLTWENQQGVEFIISLTLGSDYLLDVKYTIKNKSDKILNVFPYASITRAMGNQDGKNMLLHQGPIAVVDSRLKEMKYSDIKNGEEVHYKNNTNWIGFSDKYWLTAIIGRDDNNDNRSSEITSTIRRYRNNFDQDRFQIDVVSNVVKIVQPSEKAQLLNLNLFLGAKILSLLDNYSERKNILFFDKAVDLGLLYFITKPLFKLLSYFYDILGNFGLALMLLTIVVKLFLFPFAYKGFKSMNKLKEFHPEIAKIKKMYENSPELQQKHIMGLYKKKNINPFSGCLPILIQMPVFFALYKVLYVNIEMRHSHFFGWIQDLSAPDPTTIFNLFGLIDWHVPSFLQIGVLPILMALSMFFQQRLNPQPTDPAQAAVMRFLPLMFLFMFSSFPSGLLIYWIWSNILSILQQIVIKKLSQS